MRLALLLAAAVLAAPAQSQPDDNPGIGSEIARVPALPRMTALSLTEPVRVDGRLDEAAWAEAQPATGFVQTEPLAGAPASERTEAFVAFDRSALYVAVRCYVRDPATLVRRLVRRDQFDEASDRVFVEVGSPADGRTAFSFGVNLAGAQQDALLFDDSSFGDVTWDAVWDSAVGRFSGPDGQGYAVEIRIPFSQLRYDADSEAPWQVQFQRDIAATGERAYWASIPPDSDGYVSRFGGLHGLRGLRAPRRVEVVPYAATRLTRAPGDADDPFYDDNDLSPAVGFDARVGVTSALTLSATVNPDFGQVEQDPADVNLTDFETQFAERRPFFVEGTDVFYFGGTRAAAYVTDRPQFFYARRIGRAPVAFRQLYPETGFAYLDSPEQTTILGAGKLSGQVGEWTVGALAALTGRESAAFVTTDGVRQALPVEPLSGYTVLRARRAWNGGRTAAGAFGSAVLRDTDRLEFQAVVPTDATVVGLDAEHTFAGRVWSLSGVASGSRVAGGPGAIGLLQRSSRRYYQRTDAGYLAVDPEADVLAGYRAEATAAKVGGEDAWRGAVTLSATSPGFETNDLGFQLRADWLGVDWRTEVNDADPGPAWLQRVQGFFYGGQALNYGGDLVYNRFNAGFYARFSNLWNTTVILSGRPTYVNDRLTRGGPITLRPADYSASVRLATNRALPVSGEVSVARRGEFGHDYQGVGREWTWQVRPSVSARVTDALSLSLAPQWTTGFNTDQYVSERRLSSAADPNAPDGFGERRYVFSDVRSEALFVGLRVDWALTPDLTVQGYAGPYVDARRFSGFRQLAARRSYDFVRFGETPGTALEPLRYDAENDADVPVAFEDAEYFLATDAAGESFYIGDQDFTYLSLRGNAVVRWQWSPGSELFFVWQQTRDEFSDLRGLDVASDLADVFGGDVQNVFQIKATYWFGL